MNNGDVLLLQDSRMARIIEKDSGIEHIKEGIIQFADMLEETYMDLEKLTVEENLGNSPQVVATFYSTWSVHARLRGMGL